MPENKVYVDNRPIVAVELQQTLQKFGSLAKSTFDLDQRIGERARALLNSCEEIRAKNQEVTSLALIVTRGVSETELQQKDVYRCVEKNLELVQSLLKVSADAQQSDEARQAMKTAVQHVRLLGLVHEHLSKNREKVHLDDGSGRYKLILSKFLRDVVEDAIRMTSKDPGKIELQFAVDEVQLALDLAIPVGLLASELVSNCIRHCAPVGNIRKLSVSARTYYGSLRLVVHHAETGAAKKGEASNAMSTRLQLAANLALQLGGHLEISSSQGYQVQADLGRILTPQETVMPAAPITQKVPASWMMLGHLQRGAAVKKGLLEATDPSCYLS